MVEKPIIISLADLLESVKKKGAILLTTTIICALFFAGYSLTRPLLYTAKGTLKIERKGKEGITNKLLTLTGGGHDAFTTKDDPLFFLNSYKVAERVVSTLHLQAHLSKIGEKIPLSRRFFSSLLAVKAHNHFKKHPSPTPVGGAVCCPNRPLFLSPPSLKISALSYPENLATQLTLHFLDETTFEVIGIGMGKIGTPFLWKENLFEITGQGESGARYTLFLTPKESAIATACKQIKVKGDKKNSALIYISMCHENSSLAAEVVNSFLKEFHTYLKEEGKLKMEEQVAYLDKREKETVDKLVESVRAQSLYTQKAVEKGSFSLLGNEKSNQLLLQEGCAHYSQLAIEVQTLYNKLFSEPRTLSEIVEFVKKNTPSPWTPDVGKELLAHQLRRLHTLQTQIEIEEGLIALLKEEGFQLHALTPTMQQVLLQQELERLSRLALGPNHTERERLFAEREMEGVREMVCTRLIRLKEQQKKEVLSLANSCRKSEEELLGALCAQMSQVEGEIARHLIARGEGSSQTAAEHNSLLNEKVLTKFHGELLAMVESKNLDFHLETLNSKPFQWAIPPPLPNAPHPALYAFLGAFLTLFSSLCALVINSVIKGASASATNIASLGKQVLTEGQLSYLAATKNTLLICGKNPTELPQKVAQAAAKQGRAALIATFAPQVAAVTVEKERGWSVANITYAHLADASWKKGYDLIIYVQKESIPLPTDFDANLYELSNERLDALLSLPEDLLFFCTKRERAQLSLRATLPILKGMISFSGERQPSS